MQQEFVQVVLPMGHPFLVYLGVLCLLFHPMSSLLTDCLNTELWVMCSTPHSNISNKDVVIVLK